MPSEVNTAIRVLLIEDNEDDYVLTRSLLAEISTTQFHLEWAATYETALAAIARDDYDVCLLDYRLGDGRNGLEVLQVAVSQTDYRPIIVLTGGADYRVDREAMDLGAIDFLYKDEISVGLLERSLRYAVRQKQAIAEIRRLALESARRQQQYQALVNSIDGIVWEADPVTCQVTFISQRAERLLGYPIEHWLTKPDFWQDCIHPQDWQQVQATYQDAITQQQNCELEFRAIAQTGQVIWLRNILTLDEANGTRYLRGVMVDITEQKQAEDALRESEARYRAVVEQSAECIYLIAVATRRILAANPAAQTLLGYSLTELLNLTIYELLESGYAMLDPQMQGILAGSHHYLGEFRHRSKTGELIDISASISLIQYHGQEVFCMIAHNITEQKRIEAAQIQVRQLERLNQLKDDFLSTVSHELRTPIANIRLATQLLEMTLRQQGLLDQGDTPTQRYVQILQTESHREIELINDLLDLARLDAEADALVLTPVLLQTWMPHMIEPFEARMQEQQQQLVIEVPPDLPALFTDPVGLQRIVAELLQNACKYTPAGETITVVVSHQTEGLSLRVQNSGVEISRAECERIFDKFYRIPSNDPWRCGGTGLGLALVNKLVGYLGASIEVVSQNNQVAFTVVFPFTQLET